MSILSGLKFIPREHVEKAKDESLDDSRKQRRSGHKKERERKKKKKSSSTSSDDDLDKKRERSKKKKWYASDEDLSSYSDGSGSEGTSDYERKNSSKRTSKKRRSKGRKSKERSRSSSSESESDKRKKSKKDRQSQRDGDELQDNLLDNDFDGSKSRNDHELVRREMGLDWMLRPKDNVDKIPESVSNCSAEETPAEEATKANPRELNPYLKDGGSGYPDDSEGTKGGGSQLLSTAVIGDGGASWRLKALRRAQEQADREGRKLDEVAAERWGSLSQLAVSVSSGKAAPTRAHLHAINDRRQGIMDNKEAVADKRNQTYARKETSPGHSKMRMPSTNLKSSLSSRKERNQNISNADAGLIATAISSVNKFSNDGNFMREFMHEKSGDSSHAPDSSNPKSGVLESEPGLPVYEKTCEDAINIKPALTANQLAAKVMQLRMKGMHDEAEKLLKEAEEMKIKQSASDVLSRPQIDGSTSRYVMHDLSARKKNKMEDADVHLAQKIVQNKKYTTYGQADDEYDYDDGPRKKSRKKGGVENHKSLDTANHARRILTQQERCQFCFENPTRPKHLVVAIANFSYLSLPVWRPIAPGHCCILTMQHESATRSLDDNVWEEFRNFKKCLIMMFAKQEKDLIFLETVMSLARQKRHCLVECIPLSKEVAKQAPLYFKKAIDEAEDEWSQHNAKKLIDTSVKGLRASIPKDFPYFHVEFGLNKGFVHVIDDEKQFSSSFGLNVIRGMLKLPPEDMHQRRRRESVDTQREAVASFARDWEPFDWTKQL